MVENALSEKHYINQDQTIYHVVSKLLAICVEFNQSEKYTKVKIKTETSLGSLVNTSNTH